MDIVSIRALRIEATIGIFGWEQQIMQPLVVNLNMRWDSSKAAQTGAIDDALDYARVSQAVTSLVKGRPWGLIEEVAEAIAKLLQKDFKVPGVQVNVEKPTAVANADSVGITIIRGAY